MKLLTFFKTCYYFFRVSPSNSSKRGSRRGKLHTSLTLGHEERYSTDEESRVPATTQTTVVSNYCYFRNVQYE